MTLLQNLEPSVQRGTLFPFTPTCVEFCRVWPSQRQLSTTMHELHFSLGCFIITAWTRIQSDSTLWLHAFEVCLSLPHPSANRLWLHCSIEAEQASHVHIMSRGVIPAVHWKRQHAKDCLLCLLRLVTAVILPLMNCRCCRHGFDIRLV